VGAQAPAASQPQAAPAGQMSGMGMSQGTCMGMSMGGMKMGQGGSMAMDHGQGKPMEMGKGMEMGGMAMGKPVIPTGPMKITFGEKAGEWTPATLAALPHKTVTLWNEHVKACQTYSGVPLIELLKPLGVAEKPHGKDLRLYVVAEGADGYQVVYSVGEVTPDVHDGVVMVADTLDGKGLGDSGPLQLVATGETRPARWVRNLAAIRVKTAE
ncbi:MAG TPA: hypothetical protein VN776_02925, partial [Terracidiphilus sp.]|nr:hypothetical protein [Terracidiphilus sp.]